MDIRKMYESKKCSPEEIVKFVKDGDLCACPAALGEPPTIVRELGKYAVSAGLKGVRHCANFIIPRGMPYMNEDTLDNYSAFAMFMGGSEARGLVKKGLVDYIPNALSTVPSIWRNHMKPNVFYALVSPMDKHGYFSTGISCAESKALLERADIVLLEASPNMPRVHGDNFIHISQVTAFCETEAEVPELPEVEYGADDLKIAGMIAERIPDGACLQFGIGRIPNAVGALLEVKHDLGIHTEMFCSSMTKLIECGAVNNSRKALNKGKSVFGLCAGDKYTYDFINDNPSIEAHPSDYVNDPRVIAQNNNVVAINACLEVDLLGQICSESIGPVSISGSGGQLDFVRGANWSRGGQNFITVRSTALKGTVSTIKSMLTEGAHVTVPKNEADCIVTEYGIAELRGKSASERAKAMIAIAHPDFREKLIYDAKKFGLMI